MMPPQLPTLGELDQTLLRLGQRLVPAHARKEWLRSWQAELWFMHGGIVRPAQRRSLTVGLLRDALWLRTDHWRSALSGTALLCLLLLATAVGISAIPVFMVAGNWHAFDRLLVKELPRFAIASSLLLIVSGATSLGNRPFIPSGPALRWVRARMFSAARMALLLLLTFLASTDLCLPLETRASFAAMPLQLLAFVILALLALRWNSLDGEHRCKHCLRSLSAPARVGRPSWNFLEYNGTELVCRDGHGLLSVPEHETSWCRSSAWVPQRVQ